MKRAAVVALYMLALSGCADFIRPLSKAGMDAPTALVNGRLHGDCQPHKPWSGSSGSDVKVDNFGQANGCPSEAAVFARDNAMGLKDAVALFTDSKNDLVDVPMIRPYPVPLNIFVMAGDLMTGSVPQRMTEAESNVTLATQIYDDNQCGVTYTIVAQVHNAQQLNFNPTLLGASCQGPRLAEFKAVAAQVPSAQAQAINVFYTERDLNVQGETCADGNSAVIVIGQWSHGETLAHELGHALSLDDAGPAMPSDDLMQSPSSFPALLTIGQCFRANINSNSVLNLLAIRTGAQRMCSDSTSSLICPPLSTHK